MKVALSAPVTLTSLPVLVTVPPSALTWICDSNFMPLLASVPRMVSRPPLAVALKSARGEL
jgi:hypothetical protein